MWFWIYFGIYSFSVVVIWAFFIIAKIHSLKFKNYQPKIVWYTSLVTIILIIFTILWYILIFFFAWSSNTVSIQDTAPKNTVQEKIDNFSDISEKDIVIPDTVWEDYY